MQKDLYLATKDIEVRKRLCAEHMRTHLTPYNMSLSWYETNYHKWALRAEKIFETWAIALQYAFTEIEIKIWENCRKKIYQEGIKNALKYSPTHIKFKEIDIEEIFVKEYLRLKSDPNFGHFTMKKYDKYKSSKCSSSRTIYVKYGSIKNFYKKIMYLYPNIYFDPIPPYTEEDYEYVLRQAYKDYGFVSCSILTYKNMYISARLYIKKYGSLKNACDKFDIPYKNPKRSKLFLQAKKDIEKLLPLEMIEEKEWPEWLVYKDPLSIDIFFPFLNLAIEVDGKQHYEEQAVFHIGKHDNFKTQQIRDKIKNIELPKHNITLIRIRYDEIRKIPENLKYYVELLKTIQEYCAY